MKVLVAALCGGLLLSGCADNEPDGPPTFTYGQQAPVEVNTVTGRVPITATVRLVEPSSAQELAAGGLDDLDLSGQVPYYVRVSYVNTTGYAFTSPVPQQFRPRQDDGQYAIRLDVTGPQSFEPCENPEPSIAFGLRGGVANACLIVLVDEGQTITSVEWTFSDRSTQAVWVPPRPVFDESS